MKRMAAFLPLVLFLPACARDRASSLCDQPAIAIAAVQGREDTSALLGQVVLIEGIVTATLLDPGQWDGFFVQSAVLDGDAATSDGIFVHAPDVRAAVGQRARVRGTVAERSGMTSIEQVTAIDACGSAEAESVRLRLGHTARLEAYEGMLVEVAGPLTVADTWELGETGRWRVVPGGRLMAPTNASRQSAATTHERRRTFAVDDGSSAEPAPAVIEAAPGRPPRVGDQLDRLVGVLTEGDGGFALQPVDSPRFSPIAGRPTAPPAVGGDLRVATINVLNFFTTFGQRGANSGDELTRQEAKIVAALVALDADLVALVEVENGGSALDRLTAALSAASGTRYRVAGDASAPVGGDAIRVAFVYRPDRLAAIGVQQVLDDPVFRDRPPLAQTFRFGAESFTAVAAHFKSKGGCGDATGPDQNQGDGQGCWNDLRVREARRLLDRIASIARAAGDDDIIVLGDLNAYGGEDPIVALGQGGLVDLTERFVEAGERYSFVYRGQSGSLDYAFATPGLAEHATGAAYWHINADEARALDYRLDNPPGLYRPDPFRSSDHDPVLVGFAW